MLNNTDKRIIRARAMCDQIITDEDFIALLDAHPNAQRGWSRLLQDLEESTTSESGEDRKSE